MPSPTVYDVHVDTPLANVSIAYRNASYIADQVFPVVPVQKKSDLFWKFTKADWFRDEIAIRAPGVEASEADYGISTGSYNCTTYALAKVVPDEVRLNADSPLRPDLEATEFVTDKLLLGLERRVAAIVSASAGWAYSASPTVQWGTDTSDPLGDIENAINGVISVPGVYPNTMVMSWDVWRKLKNHPDLLDRVKYSRPTGRVEVADITSWFNVPKVLLGTALYDSAKDGQSASMAYIWGKTLWIGYVPPSPALMTPAAGYVLQWQSREIRRYRLDTRHADKIEAQHSTTEIVTASDSGAIVYAAVA